MESALGARHEGKPMSMPRALPAPTRRPFGSARNRAGWDQFYRPASMLTIPWATRLFGTLTGSAYSKVGLAPLVVPCPNLAIPFRFT